MIFLGVLSVVDTAQIALTDASAGPVPPHLPLSAGQLYSTIVLKLPYGNYRLGVFDPTVMAAIGMHWFRRQAEVKVPFAGIAIGLFIAYLALLAGAATLPLVPFLLIGWLGCELWYRHQLPQSMTEKQSTSEV